ncbi:MAG: hypothetical protein ABI120_06445 [Gemmatimonadaceae bacterium]
MRGSRLGAHVKDGIATDWPIRYTEITPWYDKAKRFAGVSGSSEGLEVLPYGQFQPVTRLHCGKVRVSTQPKSPFSGWSGLKSRTDCTKCL